MFHIAPGGLNGGCLHRHLLRQARCLREPLLQAAHYFDAFHLIVSLQAAGMRFSFGRPACPAFWQDSAGTLHTQTRRKAAIPLKIQGLF